jgi:hypothetical protein
MDTVSCLSVCGTTIDFLISGRFMHLVKCWYGESELNLHTYWLSWFLGCADEDMIIFCSCRELLDQCFI